MEIVEHQVRESIPATEYVHTGNGDTRPAEAATTVTETANHRANSGAAALFGASEADSFPRALGQPLD